MSLKKQAIKRTGTRRRPTAIGQPPRGPMGDIGWAVSGPFEAEDIAAFGLNLEGLIIVAGADFALLAQKMNQAIRDAVARSNIDRERPANHEILDFLDGVTTEAVALLKRLGLSDQYNPFPPNPPVSNQNADWFVHLRHGIAVSKALPSWLSSPDIGGLPLRLSDQAIRKIGRLQRVDPSLLYQGKTSGAKEARSFDISSVAIELMHAAPLIIALIAEAARAKAASLRPRKPLRGARPDVFRRVLFRALTKVHHDIFGVLPRILDNARERRGPSVDWIVRVLECAAKRAEANDYPGGADLCEIAQESSETLAKNFQTARTEIGRLKLNSSAVTP
jgi:hypothetical protein